MTKHYFAYSLHASGVLCRLPDRYPGQLKVPLNLEVEQEHVEEAEEEEGIANSKVFNHNMNLQTALIINTLSKVEF